MFLVLILATALAELFLSKRSSPTPARRFIRLREHRPFAETVHTANRRALEDRFGLIVDSLEERDYPLRADADGFIEPSKVHRDPAFSIVFLGDSTTECAFVDEESRFPYRAGVLLGAKLGLKINSYNAGVTGSNSVSCLSVLLNKVLGFRPQVVVLMAVINDVNVLIFQGSYWNRSPGRSLLVVGDPPKQRRPSLRAAAEALLPGLYHRLGSDRASRRMAAPGKPALNVVDPEPKTTDYESNLAILVGTCRSYGIIPVLMTQPNRFKERLDAATAQSLQIFEADYGMSAASYQACFERFNDAVRRVAAQHQVSLVDLERQIPKESAYLYDLHHFNTEGSKLAAELIAASLADTLHRGPHGRSMDSARS